MTGGEGLIYFNARYYDPTLGRFLSEDPSRKGVNWYTYSENDPINRIDPSGLDDVGFARLSSAVLVDLYPGLVNQSGATQGIAYGFKPRTVEPGHYERARADSVVPVVSGSSTASPTPAGNYSHTPARLTRDSSNPALHSAHGEVYLRIVGTGGRVFHQGRQDANPDVARTEGCVGVVGVAIGDSAQVNYRAITRTIEATAGEGIRGSATNIVVAHR